MQNMALHEPAGEELPRDHFETKLVHSIDEGSQEREILFPVLSPARKVVPHFDSWRVEVAHDFKVASFNRRKEVFGEELGRIIHGQHP